MLTGRVLSAERAASLANVAPREVLLAQIAGAFQAPLAKLAALLQAPVRSLGYALGAYRDKVTAGAPSGAEGPADAAPEAPAAEAAPAEAAPAETTAPDAAPAAGTEA